MNKYHIHYCDSPLSYYLKLYQTIYDLLLNITKSYKWEIQEQLRSVKSLYHKNHINVILTYDLYVVTVNYFFILQGCREKYFIFVKKKNLPLYRSTEKLHAINSEC